MSGSANGHMYLTLAVVAARKEQKTKVRIAITNTKQNGIDKRKAKKQNERIFFRRSGSVIKEMGRGVGVGGGGCLPVAIQTPRRLRNIMRWMLTAHLLTCHRNKHPQEWE